MFLTDLFESEQSSHITFCFGRFNPPTIGHKLVFDTMAKQGGDFLIFTSQTQDKKDNPLNYSTKIKFIKAIHPQYAGHVVEDSSLNTVLKVASYLYQKGYTSATFVAGSDRIDSFRKLLSDYNGVDGKAHGYYKFDSLEFVSSGNREDDAEGIEGISGTKAREAAAANNIDEFSHATGAGEYANELFNAVRAGLMINESREKDLDPAVEVMYTKAIVKYPFARSPEEALALYMIDKEKDDVEKLARVNDREDAMIEKLSDLDANLELQIQRLNQRLLDIEDRISSSPVAEDAAGVGVVATNHKMAKDPRYSMSITKDVKPNTPRKMAKAFRLI